MKPTRRLAALATITTLLAGTACAGTSADSSDSDGDGDAAVGELASAPGFDPESGTIRLGVLTPLSGPVAALTRPVTVGNEVWFEALNDAGGVAGQYTVELDVQDSQYNPEVAIQAYNQMNDDVTLFLQVLGTAVTKAVQPLLQADGIMALPASLDAEWVHAPELIPLGPPYQVEVIALADYAVNELDLGDQVFCSLKQDDGLGEADQEGVDFAAETLGFDVAAVVPFSVTAQDLTPQVQQLESNGCQVVFFAGSAPAAQKVYGAAEQLDFRPRWLSPEVAFSAALAGSPVADYIADHVTVAGHGGNWDDRSDPEWAEMLDNLAEYAPDTPPDRVAAYGYFQAMAITQILEEAISQGDLSRDGIQRAVESLDSIDAGALGTYTYGPPADREPPRTVSIFQVNPDVPTSLEVVAQDYASDAAEEYEIP